MATEQKRIMNNSFSNDLRRNSKVKREEKTRTRPRSCAQILLLDDIMRICFISSKSFSYFELSNNS